MTRCPHCHVELNDRHERAESCPACGKPLVAIPESPQPEPGQPTVPDRAPPEGAPPEDAGPADEIYESTRRDTPTNRQRTVGAGGDATLDLGTGSSASSESSLGKTLDSIQVPDAQPGSGTVPVDDEQSVDSVSVPSGSDSDGFAPTLESHGDSDLDPQAFSFGQPEATVDSDTFSSGDADRLRQIWGEAAREGRPGMTLKDNVSAPSQMKSNLVIPPRAMRSTTESDPSAADYEMLEMLGRGGMAVVYAARQASVDRTVAVKMLKSSLASDDRHREKFLSEAVVTGELEHPNIVPIYDLGINEDGALFYAMKRVRGTRWQDVLRPNSTAENLEVFMKVCDAVAFAHARGVVHRDLKPENIMLGDFGEVLVMDWGLAVAAYGHEKSENIARVASMGGTPAYMAPEMAAGRSDEIGFRSDIYLLGAILYECITGRPPHSGRDTMACLYAAAQNRIEPTKHGGELMEIALKAMATRPRDRFQSVLELQDAIRSYQSHTESLSLRDRAETDLREAEESENYDQYARAVFGFEESLSLWEGNTPAREGLHRARLAYAKAARHRGDFDLGLSLLDDSLPPHAELKAELHADLEEREARVQRLQRAKALARGLVAVTLIVVTGAFFWVLTAKQAADEARVAAVNEKLKADDARETAELEKQKALDAKQEADDARDTAEQAEEDAREAEMDALAQKAEAERLKGVAEEQTSRAEEQKSIAETEKQNAEYEAYVALIGLAAAKIDENAFEPARLILEQCPEELRNWEWRRLRYLCSDHHSVPIASSARMESVDVLHDGSRLASGGWDGTVEVRTLPEGTPVFTLDLGQGTRVLAVAFSPDGQWLVTGTDVADNEGRFLQVWDAATGESVGGWRGHDQGILGLAFSPDGSRLASSSFDGTTRIWTVADWEQEYELRAHRGWVWEAAFSHDGQRIATASQDGTALVWTLQQDGTAIHGPAFRQHGGPVYSVDFSPHGDLVATAGYDRRILLWNPNEIEAFDFDRVIQEFTESETSGPPPRETPVSSLAGHEAAVRRVRFSALGDILVSTGHDNAVNIWQLRTGQLLTSLRGHAGWVRDCAFTSDADTLVTVSFDQTIHLWDVSGYEEMRVLDTRSLDGHADVVLDAVFSPSGERVATASRDRTAIVWETETADVVRRLQDGHAFLATEAVFFEDGRRLLTSAVDSTTRVWDLATGSELFVLPGTGLQAAVAIAPGDEFIVTGSNSPAIQIWDSQTGELLWQLAAADDFVQAIAVSPDGRRIFAGDEAGRCMVYTRQNDGWQTELLPNEHTRRVSAVAFVSNERALSASADQTVTTWDLEQGRAVQPVFSHPAGVSDIAVAPGRDSMLTACEDGRARCWDIATGELRCELETGESGASSVTAVAITPDTEYGLTVDSLAGSVQFWSLADGTAVQWETEEVEWGGPWSAAFSLDGRSLVTVGGDEARLYQIADDLADRAPVPGMTFKPHGPIAAAAFSPGGDALATGSWDFSTRIWSVEEGRVLQKLQGMHSDHVTSVSFSPSGNALLSSSQDGTVVLWDLTGEAEPRVVVSRDDAVLDVAFHGEDRMIVAGADGLALVVDLATGEVMHELAGHEYPVLHAAPSPDGTLIATGGGDNMARLWDAETGELLFTFAGHSAAVTCVAVSYDGRRLLTGSADQRVILWDATTGKEILTLEGHTQEVTAVRFSVDDVHVLTAGRDGVAILWLAE